MVRARFHVGSIKTTPHDSLRSLGLPGLDWQGEHAS
jgi:hypothetical protein